MTAASLAAVQESVDQIIFWCVVLALLVLVLFGSVWYYRRRWVRMTDSPTGGTPWTFDDLQKMKEQGQISDEEYRALRAAMIAAFSGAGMKSPPPGTSVENGEVVWEIGDNEAQEPDFDLRNPPAG